MVPNFSSPRRCGPLTPVLCPFRFLCDQRYSADPQSLPHCLQASPRRMLQIVHVRLCTFGPNAGSLLGSGQPAADRIALIREDVRWNPAACGH